MAKVELLIELVKRHKILYDLADEDYKNIRKKDKIWDEIGLELEESGDEVKKKWKNLRDSFSKYLRSTKRITGKAAVHKTWIWAKQMESFRPFISFAKTSSNASGIEPSKPSSFTETFQCTEPPESHMDDESNDELNQSIVSIPAVDAERPPLKRLKRSTPQPTSSVKDVIEYLHTKNKKAQDDVDILFMAHAQTIKKFSPRRQAQIKFKIAKLIMEEEMASLEENSPSYSIKITSSSDEDIFANKK
ncbi:transcription factor Adf-1-like [Drosophila innubila]|uniref:transcription factor Adf-1-like n=1 Tax=Drosophila innubila TaxID=198719 RepID=UPI00148E169A|nr:transcription factor Adf-1-like [Drosophila innubila]